MLLASGCGNTDFAFTDSAGHGDAAQAGQGSGGQAGSSSNAGSGGVPGGGGTSGSGGDPGGGGSSGSGGDPGDGGTAGFGGDPGGGGTSGSGGSSGSGGDPGDNGCGDNGDCHEDEYCAKQSCNGGEGKCTPRPKNCSEFEDAVCGCDGVNYWNDCVRAEFGVAASSEGTCERLSTESCGGFGAQQCPQPGHTCSFVEEDNSTCLWSDTSGLCWGMPSECPAINIGPIYVSCQRPGNPPPICISKCEAIKSSSIHYPDLGCPQ